MPRGDFDTSEICLWFLSYTDLVISESLSLWDATFSQDLLEASWANFFLLTLEVSSQTWVMVLIISERTKTTEKAAVRECVPRNFDDTMF